MLESLELSLHRTIFVFLRNLKMQEEFVNELEVLNISACNSNQCVECNSIFQQHTH